MTNLISLPPEILQLIFQALQASTLGPRYIFAPPGIHLKEGLEEIKDSKPEDEDVYTQWMLSNPGPLYLASTCQVLCEIYKSQAIAGNLVLEIPGPPVNFYDLFTAKERIGHLSKHLRLTKSGFIRKSITRLWLDVQLPSLDWQVLKHWREMLKDILNDICEAIGDQLGVVIITHGENVCEDFRQNAPKEIRRLEAWTRSICPRPSLLNSSIHENQRTATKAVHGTRSGKHAMSLRNGRNAIPLTSTHSRVLLPTKQELFASLPLALHLYFGYGQGHADLLMGVTLSAFANQLLESLYYCSDPNNLNLAGRNRRPTQGNDIFTFGHPFVMGNPWRYFLPSNSAAHDTLKSITLDCSLFWSEIASVLPHLHKLERLDCGLSLLHTESTYPYELENQEQAGHRILDTCLNSEVNMAKERVLKENKGKRWIQIPRERIILPKIEPSVKQVPVDQQFSLWHTVDVSVCVQFMKGLIQRSR